MSWDTTTPSSTIFLDLTHSSIPKVDGFTISYWARQQASTDIQTLFMMGTQGTTNQYCGARYRSSGTKMQRFGSNGALEPAVSGTILNVWHLWIWSFYATNNRWVVQNGGSKTTNTTAATFSDPGTNGYLILGKEPTENRLYDGYIAEACLWDRELTNTERLALYVSSETGVYPNQIATSNIIGYWPLVNDALAVVGTDLVENGSVVWASGTHPTMKHAAPAGSLGLTGVGV